MSAPEGSAPAVGAVAVGTAVGGPVVDPAAVGPVVDPSAGAIEAWAAITGFWEAADRGGASAAAPRSVPDGGVVALARVTRENVRDVCRLLVAPGQRQFVAPNAVSLAEASVSPHAWARAITADDTPVGFVMLSEDPLGEGGQPPEFYLWRLMIADGFQGRGYGRAAMALIIEHVRAQPNARELLVSWGEGEGSPEPFYLGLGFERTGQVEDGEIVGRLRL